jgi:hypothetical protein
MSSYFDNVKTLLLGKLVLENDGLLEKVGYVDEKGVVKVGNVLEKLKVGLFVLKMVVDGRVLVEGIGKGIKEELLIPLELFPPPVLLVVVVILSKMTKFALENIEPTPFILATTLKLL